MATIDNKFTPKRATHPWEIIEDEIKARGWMKKDLAMALDIKAPNLSTLIKEKKAITPAMANKLEKALGIPAYSFLSLQAQYEKDIKAISEKNADEIDISLGLDGALSELWGKTFNAIKNEDSESKLLRIKKALSRLSLQIKEVADSI